MEACAADYALTYFTTPKRQLIQSPTFLWYDTGRIENDVSNNYSILRIRCRGNVFTEQLPSNDRGDRDTQRARWPNKRTFIFFKMRKVG
jgi:hypothetical protein